jgi:tetratricopeptide (TPR) repeat protein
MTVHGRAADYLQGTLSSADETAFLDHVINCAACQAALADDLQLRDREDVARAQAANRSRDEVVIPITSRRRRWLVVATAAAMFAAAAIVLVVVRPRSAEPTLLTLAPTRSIETRLGHPAAAAGFRKYDVPRGTAGHEAIEPEVLSQLKRNGDCLGLAAAYVLSGELVCADHAYARCPDGPERDADRAGLAVLRGKPEEALRLADRALAAHPGHPVALWNRALALRDLGLGLAAAEDFDRVAALDPAWTEEARTRAAALRGPLTDLRDSWKRAIELGAAMAAGGTDGTDGTDGTRACCAIDVTSKPPAKNLAHLTSFQ